MEPVIWYWIISRHFSGSCVSSFFVLLSSGSAAHWREYWLPLCGTLSRPGPLLQSCPVTERKNKSYHLHINRDVGSLHAAGPRHAEYWLGLVTLSDCWDNGSGTGRRQCEETCGKMEQASAITTQLITCIIQNISNLNSCCGPLCSFMWQPEAADEDPHWKSIAGLIPMHVQMKWNLTGTFLWLLDHQTQESSPSRDNKLYWK